LATVAVPALAAGGFADVVGQVTFAAAGDKSVYLKANRDAAVIDFVSTNDKSDLIPLHIVEKPTLDAMLSNLPGTSIKVGVGRAAAPNTVDNVYLNQTAYFSVNATGDAVRDITNAHLVLYKNSIAPGNKIKDELIASLPHGQSIIVNTSVPASTPGFQTIVANLETAETDTTPANNQSTVQMNVIPAPLPTDGSMNADNSLVGVTGYNRDTPNNAKAYDRLNAWCYYNDGFNLPEAVNKGIVTFTFDTDRSVGQADFGITSRNTDGTLKTCNVGNHCADYQLDDNVEKSYKELQTFVYQGIIKATTPATQFSGEMLETYSLARLKRGVSLSQERDGYNRVYKATNASVIANLRAIAANWSLAGNDNAYTQAKRRIAADIFNDSVAKAKYQTGQLPPGTTALPTGYPRLDFAWWAAYVTGLEGKPTNYTGGYLAYNETTMKPFFTDNIVKLATNDGLNLPISESAKTPG